MVVIVDINAEMGASDAALHSLKSKLKKRSRVGEEKWKEYVRLHHEGPEDGSMLRVVDFLFEDGHED